MKTVKGIGLTVAALVSPIFVLCVKAGDLPPPPPQVTVAHTQSDLSLVTSSGHHLVLEALAPPVRPLFLPENQAWPWLDKARTFLQQATKNQPIWIKPSSNNGRFLQDRYGRWRVWLFERNPEQSLSQMAAIPPLQARIIGKGLGRVLPLPDATGHLHHLLKLETEARNRQTGIWNSWAYFVLSPDDTKKAIGAYNLVQGRVKSVTRRPEATYLNFGQDWRDDFTVKIQPDTHKILAADGIDLTNLAGQDIRVRGWLFYQNGPMIEIRQTEQMEQLPR